MPDPEQDAPAPAVLRGALAASLDRLAVGGTRVVFVLLGLAALAEVIRLVRLTSVVGARALRTGGLSHLVMTVIGLGVAALVVRVALRPALDLVYRPLLTRGRAVRAEVIKGPDGISSRIRVPGIAGVVDLLETLLAPALPTDLVNFRVERGPATGSPALLYRDDSLAPPEERWALVDPEDPSRAWLYRES